MKQNITLSIEKDLLIKAKMLAATRQSSISRMISQELEKLVLESERYEWAKNDAIAQLKTGFHMGGGKKPIASREELHER